MRNHGWRTRALDGVFLLVIVAITVGPRLYGITSPLVDFHSWRQTHTAAVARNFVTNGYNILNPQVDQFGPQPTFIEGEFPLYQFVVALFYHFTGVQDPVARGVAVTFTVGGAVALYLLVRSLAGRLAALFAALLFALSPFGIFFGRAVMPESAMLFFSILSLYFAYRWWQEGKTSSYRFTIVCSALAIAIKLPSAFIMLPIAYLVLSRRGRAALSDGQTYWLLAGSLLPPAVWYLYAAVVGSRSGASLGVVSTMGGDRLGSLTLWLNPDFYRVVGMWLVDDITTWAGMALVALGLAHAAIRSMRRKRSTARSRDLVSVVSARLLIGWTVAVALYIMGVANGLVNQEYYILPALPIAAALGGVGLAWVCRPVLRLAYSAKAGGHSDLNQVAARLRDGGPHPNPNMVQLGEKVCPLPHPRGPHPNPLPLRREREQDPPQREREQDPLRAKRGGALSLRWAREWAPPLQGGKGWALAARAVLAGGVVGLFALTCFISVAILSFERAWPLYYQITPYVDTGRTVKATTPAGAVVIAVHHGSPEVLYYANRRGWNLWPAEFSLDRVETLRAKGATTAAIAEAVPLAGSQQMAEVLRKYPALATGPSLLIIDLTPRQGQRPLANNVAFTFGQSMRLRSYEATATAGSAVDVVLRWEAIKPMPQDYHISLRLFSANGKLAAQTDGVPVNWFFPTTRWQAGDIVDDPYRLSLTNRAELGPLRLELVVYDGATVRPLSVEETGQPNLDLGLVPAPPR